MIEMINTICSDRVNLESNHQNRFLVKNLKFYCSGNVCKWLRTNYTRTKRYRNSFCNIWDNAKITIHLRHMNFCGLNYCVKQRVRKPVIVIWIYMIFNFPTFTTLCTSSPSSTLSLFLLFDIFIYYYMSIKMFHWRW